MPAGRELSIFGIVRQMREQVPVPRALIGRQTPRQDRTMAQLLSEKSTFAMGQPEQLWPTDSIPTTQHPGPAPATITCHVAVSIMPTCYTCLLAVPLGPQMLMILAFPTVIFRLLAPAVKGQSPGMSPLIPKVIMLFKFGIRPPILVSRLTRM